MRSVLDSQNLIGAVGEAIACRHLKYAYRTRSNSSLNFRRLDKLPDDILKFLRKNWFHFDVISLADPIRLYEVKTRKKFNFRLGPLYSREKITKESYDAYMQAKELGIDSKVVIVRLLKDWQYTVEIKEFEELRWWIDKRKKLYSGRRY
ncbi:hypothetical protein KY337_06255 [Candidatus Woesearchaeota archaeon]|nr:hypothetical protein [Candidatus Woesearchaeota archaeon]